MLKMLRSVDGTDRVCFCEACDSPLCKGQGGRAADIHDLVSLMKTRIFVNREDNIRRLDHALTFDWRYFRFAAKCDFERHLQSLAARSKAPKAAKRMRGRPHRRGGNRGFKLVHSTPMAYIENEMKQVAGLPIELQLDSNLTDIQISAGMIASAMESWLVQEQLKRRMRAVIKDFLLKVRARCC
jgi:hypothetical protein